MSIFPSTVEGLTRWHNISSFFYITALVVGVVSSAGIIYFGNRLEDAANLKIADVNRVAALANERAAQLEKENLEIKRRMADRFLTDGEEATLISVLSPYSGHHITVTWVDAREVKNYTTAIITVLEKAGWVVQSNRIWAYAPAKTPRGLVCKVARQPDEGVEALKTAFRNLGITLKTEVADAQQESFIELTVGEKNLD